MSKPTEWTKVGDAYMLPESGIMYEVLTDIGNIYRGHPMDWGFVPQDGDEDDTVEKKGEIIVKFRIAPPPQAGAEDAEDLLGRLRFLDRHTYLGDNKFSDTGAFYDGEDYDKLVALIHDHARHIAAKAVEDSKKQLVSHWQPAEVEPPISYDGGNYDDAFTAGYERAIWNICTWLNPTV